jgi:hypothetical protein
MTSLAHALLKAGLVKEDEVARVDKQKTKQLRKQELGKHARDKEDEELYGRRPSVIVSGTDDVN